MFVFLNRFSRTTLDRASLCSSMTMRMPCLSDSSRRSVMPSISLSFTRSAIWVMSWALLTW